MLSIDAKDMMAPPMDPDKLKAMLKNPYSTEMLRKDIELLKLTKKHKEEQDRFNKVGNVLHALLSCLLCLVDMRLGMGESSYKGSVTTRQHVQLLSHSSRGGTSLPHTRRNLPILKMRLKRQRWI